ncbi:hypothetical protein LINPERHAP2_LOCUS34706 [Linum perenne]
MLLKKPLWSLGLEDAAKESSDSAAESGQQQKQQATSSSSSSSAVEELVNSLTRQRLYREVTLALRSSLRDARAEFSFLRLRGLRSILNFLRSVSLSDSTISLYSQTQSIPDLQVVPALFQHSLKETDDVNVVESLDHILGVEPVRITSPSTDAEVALALRVLEGCCLLHRESTLLAHQHKAIQVLMHILSTRGVLEQGACLDALVAIMMDSSANQVVAFIFNPSFCLYCL